MIYLYRFLQVFLDRERFYSRYHCDVWIFWEKVGWLDTAKENLVADLVSEDWFVKYKEQYYFKVELGQFSNASASDSASGRRRPFRGSIFIPKCTK